MNNRELIKELTKIKDKICAMIPLAANRYEDIEGCPRVDDASLRKKIYQEKFLARFAQIEARKKLLRKRAVYAYYNDVFDQFVKDEHLHLPVTLTTSQYIELKQRLVQSQHQFQIYVERMAKYVPEENKENYAEAIRNAEGDIDAMIQQLCSHQPLQLADPDMEARYHLLNQCIEYREITQQQSLFVISDETQLSKHEPLNKVLRKKLYYNKAIVLDRLQANSGFCDEHAVLGLYYIYKYIHTIDAFKSLEKINISYHQGDGHTFLVLNRNPNSQLNDMSTWGDEAILFDAWNNLVVAVAELHDLPIFYLSFPKEAEWKVDITHSSTVDSSICHDLQRLEQYFAMTEHLDPEQRKQGLMDEYELTPISEERFPNLHRMVTALLAKSRPKKFNPPIQFMLTFCGNLPVQVIQGFNAVTIALHVDIFQTAALTQGELAFGIKRALYLAKHYPTCTEETLPGALMQAINHEVISLDENAMDAMGYLNKCGKFVTQHTARVGNEFSFYHVRSLFTGDNDQCHDHPLQVKAIETMLAQDSELDQNKNHVELEAAVIAEAAACKRIYYFKDGFDQCSEGAGQMKYLIAKLPELHNELWPYEMVSKPSIRVRAYTDCLQRAVSKLSRDKEYLLDEFVNAALALRIPSFEYLYYSLLQVKKEYNKQNLRPYGRFKELDKTIKAFKSARSFDEALRLSVAIHTFDKEFANHYCELNINDKSMGHTHLFYQANGRAPVKKERFFGSMVGAHIEWSGFDLNDSSHPWQHLIPFARKDKSRQILFALWRLNVVNDKAVWQLLTPAELKYLVSPKKDKLKKITACESFNINPINHVANISDLEYGLRARYLEYLQAEEVDLSMWAASLPFEDAFKAFFDKHEGMLDIDMNNPTYSSIAQYALLRKFAYAARRRDLNAIDVIKSFFFGRDDHRDLFKVMTNSACDENDHLCDKNEYVIFLLQQRFQDIQFDIFTTDEILSLMHSNRYLCMTSLSSEHILSLFRVTANTITLSDVVRIQQAMTQYEVYSCEYHHIHAFVNRFKLGVFSESALELITFLREKKLVGLISSIDKKVIQSFVWPDPLSMYQYEHIDIDYLIYLYRVCDCKFMFPSYEHQRALSNLIDYKLTKINEVTTLITYYQKILICEVLVPITDIEWMNRLISKYAEALLRVYGTDTGHQGYFDRLQPVIDKHNTRFNKRDFVAVMRQVTVVLEAQQLLSDYVGLIANNDDYQIKKRHEDQHLTQLMVLTKVISVFNQQNNRRLPLVDFLSAPLSEQSLQKLNEIVKHDHEVKKLYELLPQFNLMSSRRPSSMIPLLRFIHQLFWEQAIKERAVIVNYLLIPPNYTQRDQHEELAYQEAFRYMADKLFKDAWNPNSDDHLALAILTSYLMMADHYQRGYLLTALLVVTNEVQTRRTKTSAAARFALLCEHMGPAFVKLAQAIHSHPLTPADIKADLAHVKGRANAPTRWDLWRLLVAVVPKHVLATVTRVGRLLGSASYNLALQVETTSGTQVLSLLRENAERDAQAGFQHLVKTINHCQHPRLTPIRKTLLNILQQSEEMSRCEMDLVVSRQQFAVAKDIYNCRLNLDGEHDVVIRAAQLYDSGDGYRLMQLMPGYSFNEQPFSKKLQHLVARAVIFIEYRLILQGRYFDSDRHGEQYRIQSSRDYKHIEIGLFDFGEMTILKPSMADLQQFSAILARIPEELHAHASFAETLEYLMRDATNPFLMRIRKGLLAMQDFHQHLGDDDLIDILRDVIKCNHIHPILKSGLSECIGKIQVAGKAQALKRFFTSGFGLFASTTRSIEMINTVMQTPSSSL